MRSLQSCQRILDEQDVSSGIVGDYEVEKRDKQEID
jgi:hypothetical protein